MAKNIKYHNPNTIRKYRSIFFVILSILLMIPSILYIHYLLVLPLLVVAFTQYKQYKILQSGLIGENKVNQILKRLNHNYITYRNLKLTHRNKQIEIDSLVLGPSGIYVIEVKHHSGTIVGNEKNKYFIQRKTRNHKVYSEKQMKNPIDQVKHQVRILSEYLKVLNITIPITGIVYFSNEKVVLKIEHNYPIIKGEEQLIRFIVNNKNEVLTKENIQKIKKYLK